MKTFHEFVCIKEEDGMAFPQNQMNPASNQMPPTGQSPEEQNPGQEANRQPPPEVAAEMENITNEIQRQISRLFQIIDKNNLNKKKTVSLLNTILQQVSGVENNANNASQNAMTTNSSGINPPMQPMASG